MSYRATLTFKQLNATPLRDLIVLRITARLDWKSRLKLANLPAPASELIQRVVNKTRLWRLEKSTVADELIAHFCDGLAAGFTADALVDRFGDQALAARLIRRAKIRNRRFTWHASVFIIRSVGVLAGIYSLLLIRFSLEQPAPAVNYVIQINAAPAATPLSDRAFPLYHRVASSLAIGLKDHLFVFPNILRWEKQQKESWAAQVQWLNQHAVAVQLLRCATVKPVMGFILDDRNLLHDPSQTPGIPHDRLAAPEYHSDPSSQSHDLDLYMVSTLLDLDTRRAVLAGDGKTAQNDLMALFGFARQLQTDPLSGGRVWCDRQIILRIQWILAQHSKLLTDSELTEITRCLSVPKVAADLLTEESPFYISDLLQQIFTDDGNGDGHLTLTGLRQLRTFLSNEIYQDPTAEMCYAWAAPVPFLTVSRKQLQCIFEQLQEQNQQNRQLPLRLVDLDKIEQLKQSQIDSPIQALRFGPWARVVSENYDLISLEGCEEVLGDRDGTLVAIALELYHRRHGRYPKGLTQLTPDLLPEVPADRITGEPVKYRIENGNPIIYSVGIDRIDDGGTPPKKEPGANEYHCPAADWIGKSEDVDRHDSRRGDWLIYPAAGFTADD